MRPEYEWDAYAADNDPYDVARKAGINILSNKDFVGGYVVDDQWVAVLFEAADRDGYSFDVAVSPEWQRKGLGSDLTDTAIERFYDFEDAYGPDFVFNVDAVNKHMVRILKRRGFEVVDKFGGHTIMTRNASIIAAMGDVGFAEHDGDTFWGNAGSGVLFTTGEKILLLKRSGSVEQPGTWGVPGGAIPEDWDTGRLDDPMASAKREVKEEIGKLPSFSVKGKTVFRKGGFEFTTFIGRVSKEFKPTLNWENSDWAWVSEDELSGYRLHFGVKYTLAKKNPFDRTRGASDQNIMRLIIRSGIVKSPEKGGAPSTKTAMPKRDRKYGVGKKMPDATYVHRMYEDVFPRDELEAAKELLPSGFEYDIVKYAGDNKFGFSESPDFDRSDEPSQGVSYSVRNGVAKKISPSRDPWIYHHKWLFVDDGYPGFDVEDAKERSRQWLIAVRDMKTNDPRIFSRIGKKSFWDAIEVDSLVDTKAVALGEPIPLPGKEDGAYMESAYGTRRFVVVVKDGVMYTALKRNGDPVSLVEIERMNPAGIKKAFKELKRETRGLTRP